MIHYDGIGGPYVTQPGDSLYALADKYSQPRKSFLNQNRTALVEAQRRYCAGRPNAKPCTGTNAWGGMTPAGCCPDEPMLASGEFNLDLLPAGITLEIPGYTPPPPVPEPGVVVPTPVKPKGKVPTAFLVAGAGAALWFGLKAAGVKL